MMWADGGSQRRSRRGEGSEGGGEEEMSNLNRLNRKVSSVITCKEIWSHTYARTQLSQV